MDIEIRKKMEELLLNEEKMIEYLKEKRMIILEISYHFEHLKEQMGLVSFYIPEELGYKLASIINPEYKPLYRISVRVAEERICSVDLEGSFIGWRHDERDEKMLKFEEEVKALSLGATFKCLPM
jgi:hypothetical protein